ncbi:transmembrane protein 216-like isoform X1 [Hydra vulgaris]|uniref:Transmembrane protein 216-like isoform X1 n=1 Tax=Hydra vulgaris TaxID=6087 RepID=A0ABM4DPK1_HYDVU
MNSGEQSIPTSSVNNPPDSKRPNALLPQSLNAGKRKLVVDLSSLPLQILLHLNVYFFGFYWICELLLYVYKGIILPYPDNGGTLTTEIVLLAFLGIIETFRIFFGYKGNLGERKQTLTWSVVLAIPILVSQFYLIFWQTYILRIEVILCGILLVMVILEVILSFACIWSFQRHESFIRR